MQVSMLARVDNRADSTTGGSNRPTSADRTVSANWVGSERVEPEGRLEGRR
jgi:hypothetical protein